MWWFLFILAAVPLFFYFSEAVTELFPALEDWFPKKGANTVVVAQLTPEQAVRMGAGEPNKWHFSQAEDGYVAWVISDDSEYRLAVGCRKQDAPSLQVTALSGATPAALLHLNYQYGSLDLDTGYSAAADLVGIVAQFSTMYLQNPATAVLTRFQVQAPESNLIARQLQSECA